MKAIIFRCKLAAVAVASCFTITSALANPTGATVVNGQVGFATQGSMLTVTNSPNAIINWQQFSINTGETTRFIQQSAQSAVLNRVVGQDPSQLLGSLLSNGRVYLINPNGILFGQGAVIDVGGLVASTLKLSDADFLAGRLNFTGGAGAGGINNQGSITTPTGGNVYLIAPDVTNSGVITSPQGEILLAAGHTVNLMDTTNPNVQVTLSAPATQAVNLGSLIARSGKAGIYGALIDQQGTVSADAAVVGDGGKIILKATGTTQVSGTLSARGGENGGDGGFIETSGAHVNIADSARIDTSAPQGKTGTWLIDPVDFTIAASGGDITGSALGTRLSSNSVTIHTATGTNTATNLYGTAGTNGDIFVNDAVSWSSNNSLTLTAARDINVNAPITATGSSALTLNAANNIFINSPITNPNSQVATPGSVSFYLYLYLNHNALGTAPSSSVTVASPTFLAGDNVYVRNGGNYSTGMLHILGMGASGLIGGTAQNFHYDDWYFAYALPFGFTFYGMTYNTMYVSSNGIITFVAGTSQYWNNAADFQSRYKMIAPAWTDWVTWNNHDIYISQPSVNSLAVRWDVAHYSDTNVLANFEAILSQTGSITYNYGTEVGAIPYPVTVGVSNGDNVHYTYSVYNNTNILHNLPSTTFNYDSATGNYVETLAGLTPPPPPPPVLNAVNFGTGEINNAITVEGVVQTIYFGNEANKEKKDDKPVCK